jgi:hypothetical protein
MDAAGCLWNRLPAHGAWLEIELAARRVLLAAWL